MTHEYWQRQTTSQPLFPALLWSRPENRLQAGKLLIVGGNAQSFAAPAAAYAEAGRAGIGTARVVLPDVLARPVGASFEAGEFAPSTPSGSFSQKALAVLIELAVQWADGVLLAGDFGRNSETAILLEKFAAKYRGQLTVTKDAADYYVNSPASVLNRPETTIVVSFAQLQRLAREIHYPQAFTYSMDLLRLVGMLHEFSRHFAAHIITKHPDTIIVAADGHVSTMPATDSEIWRLPTATRAAVWWLQNPSKPFEALTTSLVRGADI